MVNIKNLLFLAALSVTTSQATFAQETDFQTCVAAIADRAVEQGIDKAVVDSIVTNLAPIERVIELDQSQPEFSQTFAKYLYGRVSEQRIELGRKLYREHSDLLAEITAQHGVPGHYLVAFWGLETNFGNYLGTMSTLDSLATLACDARRSNFFTNELITAIELVDQHQLEPEKMIGSWAGAMGHTQFMPSTWKAYAIDGDGDGVINLWESLEDALASGANYLNKSGWVGGLRWGREVKLSTDFPFENTGLKQSKSLSEWSALGVTTTSGSALPSADLEGSVLLPAGHSGPAFLVYENFDAILDWNRSEYYALSVGVLADRIAGAGDLVQKPDIDEQGLARSTIEQMQFALNELGFDAGEPDGVMGPATRAALRGFQSNNQLIADGYPGSTTLQALGL